MIDTSLTFAGARTRGVMLQACLRAQVLPAAVTATAPSQGQGTLRHSDDPLALSQTWASPLTDTHTAHATHTAHPTQTAKAATCGLPIEASYSGEASLRRVLADTRDDMRLLAVEACATIRYMLRDGVGVLLPPLLRAQCAGLSITWSGVEVVRLHHSSSADAGTSTPTMTLLCLDAGEAERTAATCRQVSESMAREAQWGWGWGWVAAAAVVALGTGAAALWRADLANTLHYLKRHYT